MQRPLRALAAAGLLVAGTVVAVALGGSASADTQICEQYGSTTVGGRYVVQNNRWGTSAQQCINVTSSGFSITRADGSAPTNGAPVSYPSIFFGCHYTNCSPGTNLPAQVKNISSAPSSISFNYVGGATYDAAYDIWLDPSPKKDGVNQMEIMIWLNRQGSIQPIGSPVGNTNIAGRNWEVWRGSNGSNNVISYVSSSAVSSYSFDAMAFINDTRNRGAITNDWYLTSVQAGFEPWQGGVGLAVTSFSQSVNLGGNNPPPTNGPTTPPPSGNAACTVTYKANTWNSGFTADVTVKNTGNSTINGWTMNYNLPSGQTITSSWNATVTQSGSAVTARNLNYNGTLSPGASTSFGYQGNLNGSYSSPSSFTLNGTTCARG
ncbi:cellulose binding domain-containing protein [Micromonospora sp. WMMD1128]|uniref:GH12 family glycosyl hydrolase domain-containing protein n=1 Tax=unclassified Micromonospora TaxID=2617518 RepID=UPI00248B6BC6|nr:MULTISPECIES: cellulose binding domain-containing protein [unclassified Micromonospora]WBB72531.1 cellulose binding domain-containing protein [Micromonospora sp. WMMD1128]WFE34009.1 cellulose binding domain-containing protein [Micromonospora sp. WMMD975]